MALDEDFIDRLHDTGKSFQQLFYFSISIALLAIYLLTDARQPLSPEAERIKEGVEERLVELEPVYQLHDALRSNIDLVREYYRFLEPFVAIESAAEQGVVGVSGTDPAWLSLDSVDRDLARSTVDSVSWFQNRIELYMDGDLRQTHTSNLAEYFSWYVAPEREISNAEATRKLQASLRVAQALNQVVVSPPEWPASYYLHDFFEGHDDIRAHFEAARKRTNKEINAAAVYLDGFCAENGVERCSYYQIRSELDRGAFKLTTPDKTEKIEVSFFPGGLDTDVFLLAAPLLLFSTLFIALTQYYRRVAILAVLSRSPDWRAERDTPWLMTNVRVLSGVPANLRHSYAVAGGLLFIFGLTLPLVAAALCVHYSFGHLLDGNWGWIWPVFNSAALAASILIVAIIIDHEFAVAARSSTLAAALLARRGQTSAGTEPAS